jgi:starch phosphorylase
LFYERDEAGLPRRWIARMKHCLAVLAPAFNTNRMVQEYTEQLYLPALRRARMLGADNLKNAVALAHRKEQLHRAWSGLKVIEIQADVSKPLGVHDRLDTMVVAELGQLRPEDVRVELYSGLLDNDGRIIDGAPLALQHERDLGHGRHRFTGQIVPKTSGRHGFAVRIVPGGEMFDGIFEPGLIFWDKGAATVGAGTPGPSPAPGNDRRDAGPTPGTPARAARAEHAA